MITSFDHGAPLEIVGRAPRGPVTELGVADACRCAGVEFVRGVARGWGHEDFTAWFVGSYHDATWSDRRATAVAPGSVEREPLVTLMQQARGHVTRTLERHAFMGGQSAFVADLVAKGALAQRRAESIWRPVDRAQMLLRDRVLSLFAADLLMRGHDYASSPVCVACGELSIGVACPCLGAAAHAARGLEHPPEAG